MTDDPQIGKVAAVFIFIFGMFFSVLFSVAIGQPFVGAMTRLRAQYAPLAVSLDGEPTRTGPHVTGIFHALRRTLRLEGWPGLYKGAIANIILGITSNVPVLGMLAWGIVSDVIPLPGSGPLPPRERFSFSFNVGSTPFPSTHSSQHAMFASGVDSGGKGLSAGGLALTLGVTLLTVYLLLPLIVIVNRAIVTPYKLPYSIRGSIHALLSKYERQRPLILYCAPGLAVAFLLSVVTAMAVDFVSSFILSNGQSPREHPWRAAGLVAVYALSTAWLVPLSVVVAKTSVQLNLGGVIGYDALVHEDSYGIEIDTTLVAETGAPLIPDMPRASSTDEDVVQLRPALPRYTGFVDAITTITKEEGLSALYRGWIWTTLSLVLAAVAQVVSLDVAHAPPATP